MYLGLDGDEDDNEDDGYFGQEQVPLTDEIREILEEYSDGQIVKVCTCVCCYYCMHRLWYIFY